FLQDPVDDPDEWIQLRPRRWPAPPVSRRHRERQHLRHRPRVDPEPTCRLPPTHPLHIHRSPHLPVQFHAFHPSALCPSWQKTFCCRTFAPALRPVYQAASLRDFFTGALTDPAVALVTLIRQRFVRQALEQNRLGSRARRAPPARVLPPPIADHRAGT